MYFPMLIILKLDWRLSHEKPTKDCTEEELDPAYRESVRCKIFLSFTSNLVSSGVWDIIRFLVEHRMVVLMAEVNGGSNLDLVPKSAILGGTFRAFSNASLHKLRQRIEEVGIEIFLKLFIFYASKTIDNLI
ncbi:Deoxyhypusine synthase [Dendrobium catenatum]|uniref:Deoxyhypusine synthase n=1 Tax=Dendrobium catenatum TaxID=906689 RepID=A0A2I0VP33_9ASPA|nr:Deoxyhypusine synthase [Dendrobium catenatum]